VTEVRRGPLVNRHGQYHAGRRRGGAAVAELLWLERDRARDLADANFVFAHQLTPELALDLSEASFGLFIDGACDGRPAGSVTAVGLEEVLAPEEATTLASVGSGCWQDPTPRGPLGLGAPTLRAGGPRSAPQHQRRLHGHGCRLVPPGGGGCPGGGDHGATGHQGLQRPRPRTGPCRRHTSLRGDSTMHELVWPKSWWRSAELRPTDAMYWRYGRTARWDWTRLSCRVFCPPRPPARGRRGGLA